MSLEEQMQQLNASIDNLIEVVDKNSEAVQALVEIAAPNAHSQTKEKAPAKEEVVEETQEEEATAAEEPGPEEATAEEPEKDEKPGGATADDLKEAFVALTDKHGRAGMAGILKDFGAAKFSELEPVEYDQVLAAIKKKLEG